MARILPDIEKGYQGSSLAGVLGAIPSPAAAVAVVGAFAVAELAASGKAYMVRVDEIDGDRVENLPEGVIVDAGYHLVGARYCLGTEKSSRCSSLVLLPFIAESGKTYQVRRDDEFRVVLVSQEDDEVIARSAKKASVQADYDACVSFKERSAYRQLDWGAIKEDEAEKLKSEARAECHVVVWGEGSESD